MHTKKSLILSLTLRILFSFLVLISCVTELYAECLDPCSESYCTYLTNALTGTGIGALSEIDGECLNDGDTAVVNTKEDDSSYPGQSYACVLDADSGLQESVPDVIAPDSPAGDERWLCKRTDNTLSSYDTDDLAEGTNIYLNGHTFGGGVTGTYDNITVLDDSHSHSDDYIGNDITLQTTKAASVTAESGMAFSVYKDAQTPVFNIDTAGAGNSAVHVSNTPANGGETLTLDTYLEGTYSSGITKNIRARFHFNGDGTYGTTTSMANTFLFQGTTDQNNFNSLLGVTVRFTDGADGDQTKDKININNYAGFTSSAAGGGQLHEYNIGQIKHFDAQSFDHSFGDPMSGKQDYETGLWVDEMITGDTGNYGIVLDGDSDGTVIDCGSCLLFGTDQQEKLYRDSTSGRLTADGNGMQIHSSTTVPLVVNGYYNSGAGDATGEIIIGNPSGQYLRLYKDDGNYGHAYIENTSVGIVSGLILKAKNVITQPGNKADGITRRKTVELQTTNSTPQLLDSFIVLDENTYQIEATVVGVKSDGTDRASYRLIATVYRTGAGNAAIQGNVTSLHSAESDSSWDATITVNGATVVLQVTGAASTNIEWGGSMQYFNMSN